MTFNILYIVLKLIFISGRRSRLILSSKDGTQENLEGRIDVEPSKYNER